ncbi:MAG: hypothetical protein HDR38_03405 [Treponema sp.]|nr:hypothetical protein [Treponema sp.]
MKNRFLSVLALPFLFFCVSCFNNESGEADVPSSAGADTDTVKVTFYNESSFRCRVFRNVNPSSSDEETTSLVEIPAGQTVSVMQPPSADKQIGDVFYVHYYVMLADEYETGTHAIFVPAERDVSNISFVLEIGKSYTKIISQPPEGSLRFLDCYIKLFNQSSRTVQVVQGSSFLYNLATDELNLHTGKFGFYNIAISPLFSSEVVSTLSVFDVAQAVRHDVPEFTIERGKVYSFSFDGSSVSKTGEQNIVY